MFDNLLEMVSVENDVEEESYKYINEIISSDVIDNDFLSNKEHEEVRLIELNKRRLGFIIETLLKNGSNFSRRLELAYYGRDKVRDRSFDFKVTLSDYVIKIEVHKYHHLYQSDKVYPASLILSYVLNKKVVDILNDTYESCVEEDLVGIGYKNSNKNKDSWGKIQKRRLDKHEIKDSIESEQMDVLYSLVKGLNSMGVKYYIKGNILLHYILKNLEVDSDVYRSTQDLDMSVFMTKDMELVKEYLLSVKPDIQIVKREKFNSFLVESLSTYIHHVDITFVSEDITSDDLKEYSLRDELFTGSSIYKIVKDKIKVVGSRRVYSRSKDFIDLYIILKYLEIPDVFIEQELKREGWSIEFIEDKSRLLDAISANDSVYLSNSNLEEVYDYVIVRLQQLLGNRS